jgi:hypothetical protein
MNNGIFISIIKFKNSVLDFTQAALRYYTLLCVQLKLTVCSSLSHGHENKTLCQNTFARESEAPTYRPLDSF